MPKREKYGLKRLIEVRERAKDDAVKKLAERRAELASTETELQARRDAVESCRRSQRRAETEMLEQAAGGIKTNQIVAHRQFLSDLRRDEIDLIAAVEHQMNVVARAENEVEKALKMLEEAAKDVRVVEKHRENWLRDRRVETVRGEQKINDEIGAILHERQGPQR